MDEAAPKVHRQSKKAKDRKKLEAQKSSGTKPQNSKAFAVSNPGKLLRQQARTQDIKEKRFHVPLADRLPEEPAPRLAAIVGPPGVGKTVLLRSLIRRYTKETISHPIGPVTIVTSKKQRLTFFECPNSLEAMVDIAKVADIVLLMIDGNYGFEMETMEFLNILANTGMPGNIFGVLTHLDLFKKPQALKDAKKRLKHRLWNELYQGAHLFYLSGIINGRYPDREVHNLSRYLSVMKNPRPLVWRNTHPYTIIDNYRDITHPTKIEENEKCDRTIEISGYLRGTNFAAAGQRVHFAGVGDFTISEMELLPDPCPTPAMEKKIANATGKTGRRRLDEKDKRLYAPFSDRSGLKITGDHITITREKGFTFDRDTDDIERGEGERLIVDLQSERRLLGHMEEGLQLFRDSAKLASEERASEDTGRISQRRARLFGSDDLGGGTSGEERSESGDEPEGEFSEKKLGKMFRGEAEEQAEGDEVAFADSDSDLGSIGLDDSGKDDESANEDEYDEGASQWKEGMKERAKQMHSRRRPFRVVDLARLFYDQSTSPKAALRKWRGEDDLEEEEEYVEADEDNFFQKTKHEEDAEVEDRFIPRLDYDALEAKWAQGDVIEALRRKIATSNLLDQDRGNTEDDFDGFEDEGGSGHEFDDEGEGDFKDLENGDGEDELEKNAKATPVESIEAERERNALRKEELKLRFEVEDREGFLNDRANARRQEGDDGDYAEDEWYDSQKAMLQKQVGINKSEFENLDEIQRAAIEGFQAGKYARMVIQGVPYEFVRSFQPRMPLLLGGLAPTEERFGFIQARIKKFRWHPKILKTGDPLIFSLGWRRFQSLPIYSTSDNRTRNRMLKYTPEHMHCFTSFWGPLIAPNVGFVCFQTLSSATPNFRIAATGTVLSVDESTEIVKKLKLTGTPAKIFKNTAFIKDMFTSALEIAKFEGASIKTVSGVRGQIKRALSKPEGQFRATFEDRILLSDIVFLRAWYPIKPHRFYNPVTNLIGWQPMRLTGQIRRDQKIPTPSNRNSAYRKITRPERHFNPLKVPRHIAASLPFKSQIVVTKPQRHKTYLQKRAVVLTPGSDEKKARDLMQKLTTIRKEQAEKRKAKKEGKRAEYRKKLEVMAEKKEAREKRDTKAYWEREGKKRKPGDVGGGGGKRRRV